MSEVKSNTKFKYLILLIFSVTYALIVAEISSVFVGSIYLYLIFSASAWLMLCTGLLANVGYGAAALSIFLWLGLWLKLSINLYFERPYAEPTGAFLFSQNQYNEWAVISTLVCLGACSAWWISIKSVVDLNGIKSVRVRIPILSQNQRWSLIVAVVIILNIANVLFGIVQAGLPAQTIFHWPINALVAWLMYAGLAFLIAVNIHWDFLAGYSLSIGLAVAIIEGAISGVTTISRGLYLWHVLPIFLAAWSNHRSLAAQLNKKYLMLISVIAIIGFLIVGTAVNIFRSSLYDVTNYSGRTGYMHAANIDAVLEGGGRLMSLVVDRWVGAEGVMVAVGYSEKGMELFRDLLAERPAIGYVTKYQFISKSHYSQMDPIRYQFNTLPGVGGFLYLSGSKLVLFFGVIALSLLVSISENLINIASENQFLCAMSGVWMASMVAQMGVTPIQLLPQLAMNFSFIALVCVVQKYWQHIR